MFVIFLDIDGVLKPIRNDDLGDLCFSKVCVRNFNSLCEKIKTDVDSELKIVLSSSWRLLIEEKYDLDAIFKFNGIKEPLYDKTGVITFNGKFDVYRGAEIFQWIEKKDFTIDNFLVIDDTRSLFYDSPILDYNMKDIEDHLFITNYKTGLIKRNINQCLNMIKGTNEYFLS